MITQERILREARILLGQNITGAIDFSEEDILNCLKEKTLPVFSIYMPHIVPHRVITKDTKIPDREGVFRILTPYEVISIERSLDQNGYFSGFAPVIPLSTGNVVCDKLNADMRSLIELQLTFRFLPPNMLEIFPKGWDRDYFDILLKVVHPEHLQTIPHGAYETFKTLFLADLADDILSVRKFFSNLQSAFGEIEINTEKLDAAREKRDETIEALTLGQLKSANRRRIIIA